MNHTQRWLTIACTLTITATPILPATAQQLTACVRKSGRLYLIGPTYRRQQCRTTETLVTLNQCACPTPTPAPSSIITDDFDSYTSGSVAGQGGWTGEPSFVVQDSTAQEGPYALHNAAAALDSVITKAGSSLTIGRQAVYVRSENRASWNGAYGDGNFGFRVEGGVTNNATMTLKKDGHVAYYDPIADVYQNFDTYNDGEWTRLEVEWTTAAARYRVNFNSWTPWLPYVGSSPFDVVRLDFQYGNGGGVYVDSFQ